MALTVRQLNFDTSFLLTFEPIMPYTASPSSTARPILVLLDPCIAAGTSSTPFHPNYSASDKCRPSCIASLADLPEPDLVIISHRSANHCHKPTLRQLPAAGTKTLIVAEPSAARVIRRWRYFDKDKVRAIPKWQDPRTTGRDGIIRFRIPPCIQGGDSGELTVAFVSQRRGYFNTPQNVIAITYRPPLNRHRFSAAGPSHSAASTVISPHAAYISQSINTGIPILRPMRSLASLSRRPGSDHSRALSLIFAPKGAPYACIAPYATSHLVSEAALPLTCLLHPTEAVPTLHGLEGPLLAGKDTAAALGARSWISVPERGDCQTPLREMLAWVLKKSWWGGVPMNGQAAGSADPPHPRDVDKKRQLDQATWCGLVEVRKSGTEMLALGVGQEVTLTSEGVWRDEEVQEDAGPRRLPG